MSDAQVLVFGEGRKRHTLELPFRCAPGTRDVFLCANAERAGQLARAAAQGDAAMVASAGWESKARIREVLAERVGGDAARKELLLQLLAVVGLEEPVLERRGRDLSATERFRASLWLAAAAAPTAVVCDMTTIAGNVFERADAYMRVRRLQQALQFATILCISDPAYTATAGDRLSVFSGVDLVEHGPTQELLEAPEHAYLGARLAATPLADPRLQQRRRLLGADGIPATDAPLPLDLAQRRGLPRPDVTPLQSMPVAHETMIIDLDE